MNQERMKHMVARLLEITGGAQPTPEQIDQVFVEFTPKLVEEHNSALEKYLATREPTKET